MKYLLIFSMVTAHLAILGGHAWINYSLFFWVAPGFAACVAFNSIFHTSDNKAYAQRLLFWAFISQPFYMLYFGSPWYVPNILFGLSAVPVIVELIPKLSCRNRFPAWTFYAFYPAHLGLLALLNF